jgi:hypothetical protein
MGDWASDAVHRYIHIPEQTRWQVATKVTQAISSTCRCPHRRAKKASSTSHPDLGGFDGPPPPQDPTC